MAEIVKFKAQEITLTTANNVSSASVVRLLNTHASSAATITVANSGGTIATFTLNYAGTTDEIYVAKEPTDTLAASGGTVKAVSVAYK